ncbi:Chromatin modification-related protein eaf3 [Fusarium culmorum]|uniref:Chromatin modification-related protein EAF3 n=1 Tax=Fusarium culmorum TaxID=5516 RepID=A0A2T4GLX2_FUSCU|nr:Chromatin modification-related protein eaf3 [Fusarium culmorum]
MAPARQQPAPPPFSKDEKVLCFHMDMLYEAKIMDVQQGEKPSDGYKYKVHYKGWKNTWDDWVLVDRIRPFDDEHKELAAQLHAQLKHNIQRSTKPPKKGLRSGAESARVSEERSGSATVQGGRGGRRGKDWELEQHRDVMLPPGTSSASQGFPISNVRGGTEEAQPSESADPGKSSRKLRLGSIKEPKDLLTAHPSENHRYVTDSGKLIQDDRYTAPLPVKAEPKQPRRKPSKPSKHATKPKRHSFDQPDQLEMEDSFHNKPMINLPVPDHIQAMLVDDWENITKNNQLVPLPHSKPVAKIFEDYLAHERPHREEGSSSMDILEEVVAGLREYFEKALSRILLYRFERHQYMEMKKLWESTESDPSTPTTPDFLQRFLTDLTLIVSLPELLAQTNMDQQSVSRLREEIGKFNVWLGRNCETYFANEYETPAQDYIDKARSF